MGKNRLDEKIRTVLQERGIEPSEDSWSRVEKQLGSAPVTKETNFWKYGIAAGFIGILFISVFLYSPQADKVIPSNEVANSQDDTEENSQEIMDEKSVEIKSEIALEPESRSQPLIITEDPPDAKLEFAEVVQEVQEETKPNTAREISQLEKLEIKIAEVVAQVVILEESQGVVSDEVIDSLLREAQAEILMEQATQTMNKVDALALLADVEEEVNLSLRDQLFEKLKDGYLKVRTAIAYRNN